MGPVVAVSAALLALTAAQASIAQAAGQATPGSELTVTRCFGQGPLSVPEADERVCWSRGDVRGDHSLGVGGLEISPHPGWRLRSAGVSWTYPGEPGRLVSVDAAPLQPVTGRGVCTVVSRVPTLRDGALRVRVPLATPVCDEISVTGRLTARTFAVRVTAGGEASTRPLSFAGAVLSRGDARPVFRARFVLCRGVTACVGYLFVEDQATGARGVRRDRGPGMLS